MKGCYITTGTLFHLTTYSTLYLDHFVWWREPQYLPLLQLVVIWVQIQIIALNTRFLCAVYDGAENILLQCVDIHAIQQTHCLEFYKLSESTGSGWWQLWDKIMSLNFTLGSFCKWLFCIQIYACLDCQKNVALFWVYWQFINLFIKACHLSLAWVRWIHCTLCHPVSLNIHFDIILPSMPRSSKLFLSGFLTKTLYMLLFPPMWTTCWTRHILLDLVAWIVLTNNFNLYCCSYLAAVCSDPEL